MNTSINDKPQNRILLVEDSDADVTLALAAFDEAGLTNPVDVARDGQQALEYLFREGAYAERDTSDPAVVLLDLKMPRVDGLQVLSRLKADENLRYMPVVMLTSSREQRDVVQSYGLGANAYVVKPVLFDEFAFALKEIGTFWTALNHPPPR